MKRKKIAFPRILQGERQKGMSLLEVLISMLVVGLALAMSISMIQTANRFGNSAEFGSSALQQAQAIIDKMRANRVAASVYTFTDRATVAQMDAAAVNGVYDPIFNAVNMANIPANLAPCLGIGLCTAEAQATAIADMTQWAANLNNALPNPRGIIRLLNADRNSYEVIVMWQFVPETDAPANVAAQGIRLRFSL